MVLSDFAVDLLSSCRYIYKFLNELGQINKQELAVAVQQAAVSFLSVMTEDYLRTLDQASPFHPVNDGACDSVLQIQMI